MKTVNQDQDILGEVNRITDDALLKIQNITARTEGAFEQSVKPIRKNIIRRFPIVFLLLVTFGAAAVVTGIEQLILSSVFLAANPFIILLIGIGALVLTGTLYKKLG